ncbi:hypothetical protein TH61_13275 [Rufibacter sp. DG15C]|uniref:STAS/SEC14 domain-containing protein n=1 Tax=Rufibacter sp. DG15C TaxID=1379909 RepID=UPI00078CCB7A|nr:STAS/SEC14 domain-containing protein [Rufibacter sp. DG15C]AMM51956.1 hypothetical protein TH61_13275 [Rufibacter sp. DG15C]
MIYFKNNIITIQYEEARQLVYTEWHDFANSEEYRSVLNIYLQLVQEQPVRFWIGNNTKAKAIRPADQEWTAKEWAPQFAKTGQLRKMAVVVAEDLFNKMAVENMFIKAAGMIPFDTKYFHTVPDAEAWVLEV